MECPVFLASSILDSSFFCTFPNIRLVWSGWQGYPWRPDFLHFDRQNRRQNPKFDGKMGVLFCRHSVDKGYSNDCVLKGEESGGERSIWI